jgi:hypothetical protein
MGPFLDATDGVTPETGITLGAADQAEVLKANGAATVAMAGTFTAVTGSDGWYDYTASAGDLDTVGEVAFVVQDASECLPVFVRAQIIEEAIYDSLFGASADGFDSVGDVTVGGYASGQEPLQPTVAGRALDVTSNGNAGIDWGNIENQATTVDLSSTDINLCDTVTVNTDMRGTDSALLAASAPSNWSSMVISGSGSVDALTQGYLDTLLTETTAGRIAGNFDVFFENADALTTKVVDDVGSGGGGGGADWSAAERNEIRYRLGVDGTTAAPSINSPNLETVDANIVQVSGDTTAADNLELQYDGTGLTGDTFPATQDQVSRLSVSSGLLNTRCESYTLTTGTQFSGTFEDTFTVDSVYHEHTDAAGAMELYYEFNLGAFGVAAAAEFVGRLNGSNDELGVYAYNWGGAIWEQIGALAGKNGSTDDTILYDLDQVHTGIGANVGLVRIRFYAAAGLTTATLFVDRISSSYTSLADQAQILDSGTLQAAGTNSATLRAGADSTDDFYNRAKIIITQGVGEGQERIIADYDGAAKVCTTTPDWATTPDNTSVYEVLPAQTHSTTRNGGYDGGFIYVDGTNGTAGTLLYVNGVTTNPVDNMPDARTLGNDLNIKKFRFEGGALLSLDQAYVGCYFETQSAQIFNLNAQSITGSSFVKSGISGTGTTGTGATDRAVFLLCGLTDALGSMSLGTSSFLECGFQGTLTLTDTARYGFQRCAANDVAGFTINVNGDGVTQTEVVMIELGGDLTLTSMTSVDVVTVTGNITLTIDSSCTGGTINTQGSVSITDNSGGAVTITEGLINVIDEEQKIIDASVDAILIDTSTTIPAQISGLNDIAATDIVSAGAITTSAGLVDITQAAADKVWVSSSRTLTDGIQKNAAFNNLEFLMVLASDHVTPAVGLTVTGQRSIDGGAFSGISGSIAEVSSGIYQVDLLAADTNGDVITYRFSAATADDTFITVTTA